MGQIFVSGSFVVASFGKGVGELNAKINSNLCGEQRLQNPRKGGFGIAVRRFSITIECDTNVCEFKRRDSIRLTSVGLIFSLTKVTWSFTDANGRTCSGSKIVPDFGIDIGLQVIDLEV